MRRLTYILVARRRSWNGVFPAVGVAILVLLGGQGFPGLRAKDQEAQRAPVSFAAPPNSTSLNGPGNVFLTAAVSGSGGTGTVSLAVADLNNDGKLDYVTANQGNNSVGVFLGNGDGTFKALTSISVACNPVRVTVADLNGDGKPDLAVSAPGCSPGTNGVAILLGNGDGTFTTKGTLTASLSNPFYTVAGDFNGDGNVDLAVVDRGVTTDAVFFFFGNGDGTFQAPTSVSLGVLAAANQIVAADFNKDGHLDVAVSEINGSNVVVILGNGNGTFQAPRTVALPGQGWGLAVGDLNGDGVPDLVASSPAIGGISVFLGKGDGNFTPVNNPATGTLPTGNAFVPNGGPQPVAVGDFNNDVIAGLSGINTAANVAVLLGNGDGTLKSEMLWGTADTPQSVSVGDFNGDGNLDWIASTGQINSPDQGSVTLGLGRGDGSFLATESYVAGNGPAWAAAADFNKDGKLDVVVPNPPSQNISLFLGNGDGTLQPAVTIPFPALNPSFVVTGDFNNDGNADFVVFPSWCPNFVNAPLYTYIGKGDGTFQAPVTSNISGLSSCGSLNVMVAGDFNGDGKLDIGMLLTNNSGPLIAVMLGNGDGTFQAPKTTSAPGGRATWMSVGDLNKDGKLDAVVVQYMNNELQVFLGNGDGSFQAPTTLATGRLPGFSVLGDFNGDGNLDIFVENQQDLNAELYLGTGNGTFNAPSMVNITPTNSPAAIKAVGDFNLDGHLDVLFAHNDNRGTGISLLLGKGDGTFQPVQNYLVSGFSQVTAVGDFNGDGAPDALLVDNGEEFVSILLNQAPPPILVSPSSLSFGNQLIGTTSATQPINITNNGIAATTITVAAGGDFTQTNNCPVSPATLAVASKCTLNVSFKPSATGIRNGAITVTHQLVGSPETVALSGTGVAPAVTLSGASISFGNQLVGSSSAVQTVSVSNSGTAPLTISSIALTGVNSGDFSETNTCPASPATLAVSANCSVSLNFRPTATGARTASVSITDNAAGSPQSVSLTGTGTTPAVMLSPMGLTFSAQLVTTSSTAQTVTLTNNGTATLDIANITLTGTNGSDFSQTNTCGATLAVAANCSISVAFKPTAAGNRVANLTITDDANGSPQTVTLTGTGTDFSIDTGNGGTLTATVTRGQTATYSLQVTPISGFNGSVTLTCAGAPSEAACSDSPASVTPNGGSPAPFSTTVSTTAPSWMVPRTLPPNLPAPNLLRLVSLLLAVLLLVALQARFKITALWRKPAFLVGLVLVAVLTLATCASGCGGGGGGGGGPHDPGTPTGTYTVTITGTSCGVSHTQRLTLTVN